MNYREKSRVRGSGSLQHAFEEDILPSVFICLSLYVVCHGMSWFASIHVSAMAYCLTVHRLGSNGVK